MNLLLNSIILPLLEGFSMILSPCIIGVLPIVLGSSIAGGGNKRPFAIIAGFVISFVAFAFVSRVIFQAIGISSESIRNGSFVLLMILALFMVIPYLQEVFSNFSNKMLGVFHSNQPKKNNDGIIGGLFVGLTVGIIWTPCAGPILAVAIVQVIQSQTNIETFLILLFFSIGVAIPMLLCAIFGKKIMSKFSFFAKRSVLIKQIIGVVILAASIFGLFGTNISLASFGKGSDGNVSQNLVSNVKPYQAPKIAGITKWFHSNPLSIQEQKGKVVLIDFWTYSCINCIRTLPHMKELYEKYSDKGLVIIGVHAPEFDFEKSEKNVESAIAKFGIKYPVAMDNNFATWKNFDNHYWPAHYLIDTNGNVVYTHFGEGAYDILEGNIRALIKIDGDTDSKEREQIVGNHRNEQTPETYVGSARMERNIASGNANNLAKHYWSLIGKWDTKPQYSQSLDGNASLKFRFAAKKVFLVMASDDGKEAEVKVKLNNQIISPTNSGDDVKNGVVKVSESRLYELVNMQEYSDATLEIAPQRKGLKVYAFTFGG